MLREWLNICTFLISLKSSYFITVIRKNSRKYILNNDPYLRNINFLRGFFCYTFECAQDSLCFIALPIFSPPYNFRMFLFVVGYDMVNYTSRSAHRVNDFGVVWVFRGLCFVIKRKTERPKRVRFIYFLSVYTFKGTAGFFVILYKYACT